jgi:hypothetical protein
MSRRKSRPRAKAKVKVRTSKPNRRAHNSIIEKVVIVKASTK